MTASKNFVSKFGMITKEINSVSIKYTPLNDLQWLSYLSVVSTSNHLNNVIAGGGLTIPKFLKLRGHVAKAN